MPVSEPEDHVQVPPEDAGPPEAGPPAWFPDPHGRAPLRHWDGRAWSAWVSQGSHVWRDPDDPRRPLTPADVPALHFIQDVFLPQAHGRRMLSGDQARNLSALADQLAQQLAPAHVFAPPPPVHGPAPAVPRPGAAPAVVFAPGPAPAVFPAPGPAPAVFPAPGPAPAVFPAPGPAPAGFPAPSPGPGRPERSPAPVDDGPYVGPWDAPLTPRAPSAAALWWSRTKAAVGSDLAVHGLAYLGVLLLFVGVFGLVAFAFADVAPSVRPLAELAAAVVPFVAARMLLRHGATVVGRALEVVGGLLVPLMLVTSTVDGFPFPPDLHGPVLVVALAGACVAVAAGYRWWSTIHPDSGLRFAAAPTVWLAAAMATLSAGRPMPTGQDVAVPTVIQVTAMAGAMVVTLVAARRWPTSPLAAPTRAAAVPGLAVLVVLAVVTAAADGVPAVPVAVVGALLLAAAHLLRPKVPAGLLDLAGSVWWALVTLTVLVHAPLAAPALAAAGALVLLELAARDGRPAPGLLAPSALLVAALVSQADARVAGMTVAAVTVWAVWRRSHPFDDQVVRRVVSTLAAVGPIASLGYLTVAFDSLLVLAAGATALSVAVSVPAVRAALSTGVEDRFWSGWWSVTTPIAAAAAAGAWFQAVGPVEPWVAIVSTGACAGAASWGPVHRVARPWAVTAAATLTWVGACHTAGLVAPVAPLGVAVAGTVLVLLARGDRAAARWAQGAVGGAGHVMAAGAVAATASSWMRWPLAAALGLAIVGASVTAWRDESDRSPVLSAAWAPVRYAAWGLVAVAVPVWVSLVGHVSGALEWTDDWAAAVVWGSALTYAAVTRARLPARARLVVPSAAFLLALAAVPLSGAPWPLVVALAAVVALPWVTRPTSRHPVMVWAAWAATIPVAGLLASLLWPWFHALDDATATALTLAAGGAALWLGATTADLHGRSWTSQLLPSRAGLLAPAVLGMAALAAGLGAATVAVPTPRAQQLVIAIAAVILVAALLARTGALGGGALVLGWAGVVSLGVSHLYPRPWIAMAVSASLLVAAVGVRQVDADRGMWSRWDVPLLVAAAPVAATALHTPSHLIPVVYTIVGLEVVAVCVRLRRRTITAEVLGWTGTALITVGAAHAGPGWLAVALAALAAAHTTLAVHARPRVRPVRQVVAAVAALSSWAATLDWARWPEQVQVDVSAVLGGVVALGVAAVASRTRLPRSWVVTWSGAGGVMAGAAALAAWSAAQPRLELSWSVVGGLALVTAAAGVAARPCRAPWLRDVTAGGTVLVTLCALEVLGAGTQARVVTLSLAAVALAILLLLVRGRWTAWDRPLAELGAALSVVATGFAFLAPEPGAALVPAVAAVAVQVVTAGVVLRALPLQVTGTALGCVAWLLLVSSAGVRGPEWYTVAIGLALLVVVALWRRDRRLRAAPIASKEIVALELAGLGFLVGAAFVAAVTESVVHGFGAAAIGVGIGLWGLVTRVRRRVVAAVAVVLASVVVVVAVPLVALLPAWGGAGMWVGVAGLGLVAVGAATMLERARAVVDATRSRIERLTAGWE